MMDALVMILAKSTLEQAFRFGATVIVEDGRAVIVSAIRPPHELMDRLTAFNAAIVQLLNRPNDAWLLKQFTGRELMN